MTSQAPRGCSHDANKRALSPAPECSSLTTLLVPVRPQIARRILALNPSEGSLRPCLAHAGRSSICCLRVAKRHVCFQLIEQVEILDGRYERSVKMMEWVLSGRSNVPRRVVLPRERR